MNTIGDNLKIARLARGQTQEEVAQELGVATETVNRWERGHYEPMGLYAEAVARYIRKGQKDGKGT